MDISQLNNLAFPVVDASGSVHQVRVSVERKGILDDFIIRPKTDQPRFRVVSVIGSVLGKIADAVLQINDGTMVAVKHLPVLRINSRFALAKYQDGVYWTPTYGRGPAGGREYDGEDVSRAMLWAPPQGLRMYCSAKYSFPVNSLPNGRTFPVMSAGAQATFALFVHMDSDLYTLPMGNTYSDGHLCLPAHVIQHKPKTSAEIHDNFRMFVRTINDSQWNADLMSVDKLANKSAHLFRFSRDGKTVPPIKPLSDLLGMNVSQEMPWASHAIAIINSKAGL